MDTSSSNTRVQPSIRSFFQPRQPNYAAPPGPSTPKHSPALLSSSTTRMPPPAASSPLLSSTKFTPQSTKTTSLPPQATISPIQQPHIQPLKRINALLLPIHYPDSFYHKILSPDPSTPPNGFSRAILWTDPITQDTKVVGGVVCRLDPGLSPNSTAQNPEYLMNTHDIYIQSLTLLSPYRGRGLVAAVLNEIIEAATRYTELHVNSLYAHVWTQSEEASEWYAARGFKREEPVIKGYYRSLNPDTAHIFRRPLVPSDHLQSSSDPAQGHDITSTSTPPTTTILSRPPIQGHARSFQERGPDREWNDLPEDIFSGTTLKPPSTLGSQQGSATSSRSSSRSGTEARGKKKRAYPAAAFGNP